MTAIDSRSSHSHRVHDAFASGFYANFIIWTTAIVGLIFEALSFPCGLRPQSQPHADGTVCHRVPPAESGSGLRFSPKTMTVVVAINQSNAMA